MGSLVLSNSTTSRRECMHLLPKVYVSGKSCNYQPEIKLCMTNFDVNGFNVLF
jgi:hypothetical protein